MDAELKKPSDRLEIDYKGTPRTLFMSYLRLNSCLRVLGEPERLSTMLIDPDLVEMTLRVMLAEKGGAGTYSDVELEDGDLSNEDVDKTMLWVNEHLAHFFMKRFQQLGEQVKGLGPTAEALKLSLLGSESSTSSEAAAGPST